MICVQTSRSRRLSADVTDLITHNPLLSRSDTADLIIKVWNSHFIVLLAELCRPEMTIQKYEEDCRDDLNALCRCRLWATWRGDSERITVRRTEAHEVQQVEIWIQPMSLL